MKTLSNLFSSFIRDEEGIALTEYLILLGLLVGGVIASILLIGGELNTAWASWATFFEGTDLDAPPAAE